MTRYRHAAPPADRRPPKTQPRRCLSPRLSGVQWFWRRPGNLSVLIVLLLAAGCEPPGGVDVAEAETPPAAASAITPAPSSQPQASQPQTSASLAGSEPIIDCLDRSVDAAEPARRIISLTPAMTELLFALDLGPAVVGATTHCNYPPEALEIPRVGAGTLESVSREAIVAAKPDLVLCKWDYHQPLIESLDRLNIRALAVGPQSLEELFEQTRWLGRITDRRQQAEALIDRMTARHQALLEAVERVKPSPPLTVFYEVWDEPLMSAGPESFIADMLRSAGLKNIIDDTDIAYPRISSETVLRGNPDLILAPTTHFETVAVASIARRPGWDRIPAVRDERIYLISGDEVSRCGPRMLDALTEIILAAYPELTAEQLGAAANTTRGDAR
ncbi:ABC transporter substrate-binding protein [Roseimaritima sediminicola]|uniref:ABC transporter substrate-binding protein n=1 Tax=Roseimaritima sediminicola TaxID=2662066 RepID=UPI001298571D|nr:helical backbone metal receptor [Roseimaritima sediminicola]